MKKNELLKVLNLVKPGIASKDVIEGMTYFYLNNNKVIAYNDQICVQHPFDFDFSCFVKANDLTKVLTKLKSDDLTMNLNGNNLNIKCGRSNINLASIKDPEIISRIKKVNKSLKKVKWSKLPSDFIDAVTLCSFSASTNESLGTLTYIHIVDKKVMATNNVQLSIADIKSKMDNMFIKATAIKDIANLKPEFYVVTDSWIHFKNAEGCIFSTRTIKGEFPDINVIFDRVKDAKAIQIPDDITEGVDIASIFADDNSPTIKITIADDKCKVDVQSESGSMSFSSKMKYSKKEILFLINPEFLIKMLDYSSFIKIGDSVAMIESDNFKLATALIGE